MEPFELARLIVDALEDKKGTSERNLKALQDAIVDEVRPQVNFKPRIEGRPGEGWLLADFGSVMVHLFSHAQRDYYRLEDLWEEAKVVLHVQ